MEKCREIRQELISETETIEEDKQHQEEITSVTTDSGKGTDRLINLNIATTVSQVFFDPSSIIVLMYYVHINKF